MPKINWREAHIVAVQKEKELDATKGWRSTPTALKVNAVMCVAFAAMLFAVKAWGFAMIVLALASCVYYIARQIRNTAELDASLAAMTKMVFTQAEAFPPGEVVDRISIGLIKTERLAKGGILRNRVQERLDALIHTYFVYSALVQDELKESDKERLVQLANDLLLVNKDCWEWQDLIRNDDSIPAALGAAECNQRRFEIKNEINRIFGYGAEVKVYEESD